MPGDAYLIDSNILIRWVKPDDRHYSIVNNAIDGLIQQGCSLYYTSQNIAEFWNTCTRPAERNGYGLSTEEADARAGIIERTLEILPDGLAVHHEWRKLIVMYRVSGLQVHDARLVASMHIHDVKRILTFNGSDLSRYTTIEAWDPETISGLAP